MKSKSIFLFGIVLIISNTSIFSLQAQEMSQEHAFFYFLKVYDRDPAMATSYTGDSEKEYCGKDYITYYANAFDSYNYKQKKGDEFEINRYLGDIEKKIRNGISNVNFSNKYSISSGNAQIGEYSFSDNSFPIYFSVEDNLAIYKNVCYLHVYGEVANLANLKFKLKMPEANAKTFIANRKDPNGKVNRRIYLTFNYSVINKKSKPSNYATNLIGSNFIIYVYSIDIYDDKYLNNKLGTITSSTTYSSIVENNEYQFLSTKNLKISGEWEGRGEFTGSKMIISEDKNCKWIGPSATYSGKAQIQDQSKEFVNHGIEDILKKIDQGLKKTELGTVVNKISLYANGLNIFVTVDNKSENAFLTLFTDGSKIFAWAGGESFFEFVEK